MKKEPPLKPGRRATGHIVRMCFVFWICILLISGCQREKAPIKIGFVSNLTGVSPALKAINTRNGAIFAVDEINADGGIHGRKIELIVKDDRLDPETARKVNQELIREHVAAIVGPVRSEMCLVALPLASRERLVLMSPFASSNQLTGKDDFLFRINTPASGTIMKTANYAYSRGLRKIAVVYDLENRNFSEPAFLYFKKYFEAMGGRVTVTTFTAGKDVSYPNLVGELMRSRPDGYYIIATPVDSAMICQHLRKKDSIHPVLLTGWAFHPDLLKQGGKAVEGVVLAHAFQPDSKAPAFLQFQDEFFKRYKTIPETWETFGYEAVMVLAQALSQNPDPKRLKETILAMKRFKGLQGDIVFDRYGDNQREPFLLTIRKGAFVEIR
ncbi:MAG: ABC transporter substrate-binding protein [Syntrophaceae bacterium]